MGLMKKIDTDGLGTVIENIKEAHLDNDSMNKLIQALTCINHHIQSQSSVTLEQMENQLGLFFFSNYLPLIVVIIFYRYGVFHRNT